jgi:hypothetical protein
VISRPRDTNPFEFATVAALRTKQLMRGCISRVTGPGKLTTLAQSETAAGLVQRVIDDGAASRPPQAGHVAAEPTPPLGAGASPRQEAPLTFAVPHSSPAHS